MALNLMLNLCKTVWS